MDRALEPRGEPACQREKGPGRPGSWIKGRRIGQRGDGRSREHLMLCLLVPVAPSLLRTRGAEHPILSVASLAPALEQRPHRSRTGTCVTGAVLPAGAQAGRRGRTLSLFSSPPPLFSLKPVSVAEKASVMAEGAVPRAAGTGGAGVGGLDGRLSPSGHSPAPGWVPERGSGASP